MEGGSKVELADIQQAFNRRGMITRPDAVTTIMRQLTR